MFKTIQLAIMILACALVATAQTSDYKKLEFYAGYSFSGVVHGVGDDRVLDNWEDYSGFSISITRNLARYAGLKFDLSGQQIIPVRTGPNGINLDSQVYNFAGGLQIKDNSTQRAFKPFVHALVGFAHIRNRGDLNSDMCFPNSPSLCHYRRSDVAPAGDIGGGIDIRAGDRLDIRVIQVDYNATKLFDSSQRTWRVGFGIAIH